MNERRKSNEALECTHCGAKNRMGMIGTVTDAKEYGSASGPSHEAGVRYEIQSCPNCGKIVLVGGEWHDMMEDPDEWRPAVVLPESRDRTAREILAGHDLDLQCMVRAITEARKCKSEDKSIRPRVGAVVARENAIVDAGYRGELLPGDHAEYTVLEGKCKDQILAGATVYTTLEPCTTRNPPKIPCVERLIKRKVSRVVVGMLDPDERIRGRGVLALRKANIRVDLFPPDLMAELEELNRDFISDKERSEVGSRNDTPLGSSDGRHASSPLERTARTELRMLAKYLLSAVQKLPDGSPAAIQRADRILREALLPPDDDISRLRGLGALSGSSAGDLALAASDHVAWMVRTARLVQGTSREMGFDYRRINWEDWASHWSEAKRALLALIAL